MSEQIFDHTNPPVKVIEPDTRWWRYTWAEIAASRELVMLLSWSAFSTRFKQMALGMAWAALEPLALLLTMVFVFSYIFRLPSGGLPYPLLVATGLVTWMTFHRATMSATDSLSENLHIVSKIYFPRIVLPAANSLREIYGAIPMLLVMLVLVAFYGFTPSWKYLTLPFILLYAMFFACGIGLWLSAAVVRYRDIRSILQIILQIGVYLSPVCYHPMIIPESVRPIYELNPLYWIISTARWAILDTELEFNFRLLASIVFVCAVFASGLLVFARYERNVVDDM